MPPSPSSRNGVCVWHHSGGERKERRCRKKTAVCVCLHTHTHGMGKVFLCVCKCAAASACVFVRWGCVWCVVWHGMHVFQRDQEERGDTHGNLWEWYTHNKRSTEEYMVEEGRQVWGRE